LLATDFGRSAALARDDAAMLARAYSAPVDLVHVHAAVGRTEASRAAQRARTGQHLAECRAALVASGVSVGEVRVTQGSVAEALLHTAEALDTSLVVIGSGDRTHGEPGTGATAETVARFARQWVWISRPRRQPGLTRVLCAVDCSDASLEALAVAADLSARFAATLEVIHVLEHPDFGPDADTGSGELAEHARTSLAAVNELVAGRAAVHAEWGRASEVLTRLASNPKCDLLVIGRTGVGGLRRVFLGGTAERLLRAAPCSLLLTSPAGP